MDGRVFVTIECFRGKQTVSKRSFNVNEEELQTLLTNLDIDSKTSAYVNIQSLQQWKL